MTSGPAPKVTVFIPVYNRERYVGEAIRSVLAQSFADFEVLAIDDGSTDGSREVVAGFADPRVRLVCNDRNLGIPRTRNRGLDLARGAYLALLDSDDRMHPERLARQAAFLDAHPDYAEIGSWGRLIDAEGRPLGRVKRQPLAHEDVRATLLFRCCISNRSVMGRTALMRAYGYDDSFPRCQDYELHVRLAHRHKVGNLPDILVDGRMHPEQTTRHTAVQGEDGKRRIAAGELAALGVEPSDDDLGRHVLLARLRKTGTRPGRDYVDWAEGWLRRLLVANRRARVYDGRALAGAVAETWFGVCRAAGGPAWRIGGRFLGSPLGAGAGSAHALRQFARAASASRGA